MICVNGIRGAGDDQPRGEKNKIIDKIVAGGRKFSNDSLVFVLIGEIFLESQKVEIPFAAEL